MWNETKDRRSLLAPDDTLVRAAGAPTSVASVGALMIISLLAQSPSITCYCSQWMMVIPPTAQNGMVLGIIVHLILICS